MNPVVAPMELQMQLHQHQRMLLSQQQIALRHRLDILSPDVWPIPTLGRAPLQSEVRVELQNKKLWQEFHAETTEMIITKLGRRMFPSIQLTVSGLEKRARYYIILEIVPASYRRLKYSGNGGGVDSNGNKSSNLGGWTSAGPAEPQSRLDRRIYLHPDSPAPGAHWMQHPISFSKLKLTNNAVDHRNNVVLTSMHKYVPKIWIIRCNNAKTINELYSHPASSFIFNETEFIAVTAYQNENITKLKIDNNPFAKGFRETGQSRCKRKFQHINSDGFSRTDDEECNSSSESESNQPSSLIRKSKVTFETVSLDDNACDGIRPILPAVPLQNLPMETENNRETPPRLHRPWLDTPSSTCKFNSSSVPSPPSTIYDVPSYYFRFTPFITPQSFTGFQQWHHFSNVLHFSKFQ